MASLFFYPLITGSLFWQPVLWLLQFTRLLSVICVDKRLSGEDGLASFNLRDRWPVLFVSHRIASYQLLIIACIPDQLVLLLTNQLRNRERHIQLCQLASLSSCFFAPAVETHLPQVHTCLSMQPRTAPLPKDPIDTMLTRCLA
ncbi:hypothetical protein GGI35DRAFT_59125 [Trichoderma velutinum]